MGAGETTSATPVVLEPRFLSDLAHQLRNTLFCFSAGLDALSLVGATAETREALAVLRAEAVRLGRLAADLDLLATSPARPDADFSLGPLARAVVADTLELAGGRGVALELAEASAAAPRIHGHAESLRRVIGALIEHAVLRSAVGQRVRLLVRERSDALAVELLVEDSGPPHADEALARALEPFVVRGSGRTGLALAVAARLAAASGGSITLANRPGGGGEARLLLPYASRT